MAKSKVYPDAASALEGLTFDGMTVMSGGFGLSGNPENLITALKENGVKNITVISNNCGADERAVGAAEQRPDQEDDLVLCGREQAVREPLSSPASWSWN